MTITILCFRWRAGGGLSGGAGVRSPARGPRHLLVVRDISLSLSPQVMVELTSMAEVTPAVYHQVYNVY